MKHEEMLKTAADQIEELASALEDERTKTASLGGEVVALKREKRAERIARVELEQGLLENEAGFEAKVAKLKEMSDEELDVEEKVAERLSKVVPGLKLAGDVDGEVKTTRQDYVNEFLES